MKINQKKGVFIVLTLLYFLIDLLLSLILFSAFWGSNKLNGKGGRNFPLIPDLYQHTIKNTCCTIQLTATMSWFNTSYSSNTLQYCTHRAWGYITHIVIHLILHVCCLHYHFQKSVFIINQTIVAFNNRW